MFQSTGAAAALLLTATLLPRAAAFECGNQPAATRIWRIQGEGAASPIEGQVVEAEGVVTGSFQGPAALNGFFLQEEAADSDGDPATSDGIFVFAPGGRSVRAGDVVRVKGTVAEYASAGGRLTQIAAVMDLKVCAQGALVAPVAVPLPLPDGQDWERYEGMLVRMQSAGPLVVTGNHDLGRFGSVEVAPPRLFAPTQQVPPGEEARARALWNARAKLVLDDASSAANANLYPTAYPEGGLRADRTLRVGDHLAAPLEGVLDDRFGAYRLHPVAPVAFLAANPRPPSPPEVGGRFRAAAANVLNFFTTTGAGPVCGPGASLNCRGATDEAEYQRQLKKLVAMLRGLEADVIVLNEVENNPAGAANPAVAALVSALNHACGAETFRAIDTGPLGTDAIRNAILYQPARVEPVGVFATAWLHDQSRPSVAQTFQPAAGPRPDLQRFTVVANHWKSKSGSCDDDGAAAYGQGACNFMRLRMARHLVEWLAGNPTGDPTPESERKILLLGDFNCYLMEDPMRALTDPDFSLPGYPALAGSTYVNLVERYLGTGAYSYNYQGQSGYLDHALANPAFEKLITGVAAWHINADEPAALDYNLENKSAAAREAYYSPDPFRASDHDPLVVGFNPLAGDLNNDGAVDGRDRALLRAAMGKPAGAEGAGRRLDLDGDGVIARGAEKHWKKLRKAYRQ